jgi:hypothetical protein
VGDYRRTRIGVTKRELISGGLWQWARRIIPALRSEKWAEELSPDVTLYMPYGVAVEVGLVPADLFDQFRDVG